MELALNIESTSREQVASILERVLKKMDVNYVLNEEEGCIEILTNSISKIRDLHTCFIYFTYKERYRYRDNQVKHILKDDLFMIDDINLLVQENENNTEFGENAWCIGEGLETVSYHSLLYRNYYTSETYDSGCVISSDYKMVFAKRVGVYKDIFLKVYCPVCKKYERASIKVKLFFDKRDPVITLICNECETYYDQSDIYMPMPECKTFINRTVFYDDNKITISSIERRPILKDDRCILKSINYRIVFNTETGRTYKLNNYDLNCKSKIDLKTSPFKMLNSNSEIWNMDAFIINPKDYMNIGLNMQFKHQQKHGSKVINFKKYLLDAIKISDDLKGIKECDLNDLFCKSQIDAKKYIKEYRAYISILIAYNSNPFCDYCITYIVDCTKGVKNKEWILTRSNCISGDICEMQKSNLNDSKSIKELECNEKCLSFYKKIGRISRINKSNNFEMAKSVKEALKIDKINYKNINSRVRRLGFFSDYHFRDFVSEIEGIHVLKKYISDINNLNKLLLNGIILKEDVLGSDLYKILISKFGETNVINAICKNDYHTIKDSCKMFDRIIKEYPSYKIDLKRLRLNQVHDNLSKDYLKITGKLYEYNYNKELENHLNRDINGIEFKLATKSSELVDIGSRMKICVGSYDEDVSSGRCFIVYMRKNGEYVGCLEIDYEGNLIQAKYKRNELFTRETGLNEVLDYLELTNIQLGETNDINIAHHNNFDGKSYIYNNPITLKSYGIENEIIDGKMISKQDIESNIMIFKGKFKFLDEDNEKTNDNFMSYWEYVDANNERRELAEMGFHDE